HHIYSPPSRDREIRRWKSFLDDERYGFKRIAGFSGTCYIGNNYFPDVVYRYSIRQAMEDRVVKQVTYRVTSEAGETQASRFQKYLQLHHNNQQRYENLKPLSVLVTDKVNTADDLARQFTQFLAAAEGISLADAEAKVLVVSSRADHRPNVARLATVDRLDDPIEWIFSVSMLTEGWDVHNVFQIIPHEKRAFASKLLIAQVLGRGLRRPEGTSNPQVWVFNHVAWAGEIKGLVDDLLEQERRLHAYLVEEPPRADYHFDVDQITYETETDEQSVTPSHETGQVRLFRRGFVQFENQSPELERRDVFTNVLTGAEATLRTQVRYDAFTVDEAVQRIRDRLRSIDAEGDTNYLRDYPTALLRDVINSSLTRIGETRGLVSDANLQHLYRAIGNIHRESARSVRLRFVPNQVKTVSTHDLPARSVAVSQFTREGKVFFDSHSRALSQDEDQRRLDEVTGEESEYPRRAWTFVDNSYLFKSPTNVVLTSYGPEREFAKRLFEVEVANQLNAWVKAPDVGWYDIAFSWRKGDHTKRGRFHPDFFIQLKGAVDVLVVEIKGDDDDSDENRAKLRAATEHFQRVNAQQSARRYYMKFLSPVSYVGFFQAVRDGTASAFVGALQAQLAT
ncbi:MAG: type restriction enzyme, partial [Frankiaceae bacterium]|nr:type restriction enzyme [Frankiaceae bacterium]